MFLSDDLGMGMGLAIVAISCAIKLVFLPIQLKMVGFSESSKSKA